MAAPGGFSYKPNVNRAVTKKWKEASQANYGGDEWGDDDDDDDDEYGVGPPAPVSAGNARHPGWGGQQQSLPSNRSVTNPSPSQNPGRPSFDRGDERRIFSAGPGGFDSPYPTSQRAPFAEPQHDFEPSPNYRPPPPPAAIHTQGHGPYPPPFRPSSRGGQYPPHPNAPFSAPGAYPSHERSESGHRSNSGAEIHQRRESPVRPDSRASNASAKHFPPRKSSLSQQQPPQNLPPVVYDTGEPASVSEPPPSDVKAFPFIRPSDIYKRMEEEREKERRSQESSRPSLDLNTSRTRDSSTSARSAVSDHKEAPLPPAEESDSSRRLKPTLDTVVERKSEYGFDNYLKEADATHPSVQKQIGDVNRHPTNASSVYTDRPDPVSASTASASNSPHPGNESREPYSASSYQYNLPSLGKMSSLGSDVESSVGPSLTPRITEPERAPPPVPVKDAGRGIQPSTEHAAAELSHQSSLGYRSVVEQAFDQSQNQNPLSPSSGDETLPRSNSASTSDISPIIARHHELPHGPSGPPVTDRPIPEEPVSTSDRPLSDSTITAGDVAEPNQPLPPPPVIRSGYRRDGAPLSRDNSPAKQPLSVQTVHPQRPVQAVVASTEDIHRQGREESARGRSGPFPPSQDSGMVGGLMSPQSNRSTTSDEYKVWQDQQRQFNARYGNQASNPGTPGRDSPMSRAESPNKNNVKDLADKYENRSGRSTPVSTSAGLQPHGDDIRPAQLRQESFRPSIPGGWQSSSTVPQLATPRDEFATSLHAPKLADQVRHESTESIPTARAPSNWTKEHQGSSGGAFAAAAAAGTALAGAFSGPAFMKSRNDSPERSEDSWERSPASSVHVPEHSDTRDFGAEGTGRQAYPPPTHDSLPPTPLPKDTPILTPEPATVAASMLRDEANEPAEEQSTQSYFPAPLRTSRSVDTNGIMRPPIPTVHDVHGSPLERDNDELQRDIVKSLTPKSSNFEPPEGESSVETTPSATHHDLGGLNNVTAPQASKGVSLPQGGLQRNPQSGDDGAPPRPYLEQRFSWEMDPAGSPTSAPQPQSARADVAASVPPQGPIFATQSAHADDAADRSSSDAPVNAAQDVSSPRSATTPRPISGDDIVAPPTVLKDVGPLAVPPAPVTGHPERLPFRKILALEHSQQRTKAFADSRDLYSQSDGLLDQWILSLQTPEHADVFQRNGQMRQPASGDPNSPHRPSPNRPLASISGSKLVQEDGKRLVAASKRFGGKAGFAAKGLLAKGKDKLRSASAGDKDCQRRSDQEHMSTRASAAPDSRSRPGFHSSLAATGFLTSRRKSAGSDLLESKESQTQPSNRDSSLVTTPPQLPPQTLNSSPLDAGDWFGTEGQKQDVEPTVSNPAAVESNRFSAIAPDNQLQPQQSSQDRSLKSKSRSPSIPSRATTPQQDEATQPVKPSDVEIGNEADIPEESPHPTFSAPQEALATTAGGEDAIARPVANSIPELPLLQAPEHPNQPSGEQNLTVPSQRPHSVISNISSPSPITSQDGQQIRSVSPADPRVSQDENIPVYHQPILRKEDEVAMDRRADDPDRVNDPLPIYEETPAVSDGLKTSGITPDAQIVPVADLSGQRRQEEIRNTARPFSFEGSEYLNQAIAAGGKREPVQNPPSLPLSPVSQTLSKSLSQVSAEVTADDQDGARKAPKSYSRPFGADIAREHPALRQPDPAIDRSRMYSSESPLPSARRPQEDLNRPRQQSPARMAHAQPQHQAQPRPVEEGGYRIPGPHFQELRSPRSPRRNSAQNLLTSPQQTQQQPTYPQQTNGFVTSPQQQLQYQRPETESPQWQQTQVSSPAQAESSKKPKFGGLFQSRSKTPGENGGVDEVKQRTKLKRNSRRESMVSHQSSTNENRDVLGQLPSTDVSRRRESRDLARSATPTDQTDGKKKRFSAMGNLFTRGSRTEKAAQPQRASTLPTNASPPNRHQYPAPVQRQYNYGRPVPPQGQVQHPPGPSNFTGAPPPPGGYCTPAQQYHPTAWPAEGQEHYQARGQPLQGQNFPKPNQHYESRPAHLRIDTSNSGRSGPASAIPATAPPQTRASRDISYQSRPYEYQPVAAASMQSPSISTTTPATASNHRPHNSHVVALHKRSRSPKLGRPSSSDDPTHLHPPDDAGTPVSGLGTFSNKKVSPVGGIPRPDQDQEAPFRIDIPGEPNEEERRRGLKQKAIEQGGVGAGGGRDLNDRARSPREEKQGQTVADRMTGPQMSARADAKALAQAQSQQQQHQYADTNTSGAAHASTTTAAAAAGGVSVAGGNKGSSGFVAELPGSKANGYESDEEVQMSATAYPGNWQDPVFFGDGKWDD